MKHLSLSILICLIAFVPVAAYAYGGDENQEMKNEVREAISRAHDFTSQKIREATEDREREQGAREVTKKRESFENEQEKEREAYVRERNSRPSEFLTEAHMERQFDQQKVIEDREMDKARLAYISKRRRVAQILKTKARINENEEYGL